MKHVSFALVFVKNQMRFALFAAVLFVAACSSSDEEAPAYLDVTPQQIAFDAKNPESNAITIRTMGMWSVKTTPSTLKTDRMQGTGDAVIRVTDAPAGRSILTVTMGLRSATVTVTREAEEGAPNLALSPEKLEFDPDDAAANVITVACDAAWKASSGDPALTFTSSEGTGDGKITITGALKNQTTLLTVVAGGGDKSVTRIVSVSYPSAEVVYADDFDLTALSGSAWADQSSMWQNPAGPGAGAVTYTTAQVQMRNDAYGSSKVGSGMNYARLFFDGSPSPQFLVGGIALPAGERSYTLSMSASFTTADCNILLSTDGGDWSRPLEYEGVAAYNTWGRITVGFTLSSAAERLYIRLVPAGPKQAYGINFDDLKLTTGGGGQTVSFEKKGYRWVELPANAATQGDCVVNTYWSTTVMSNQHLRNFTYCYDTRRHCPLWIAHPQHACYQEGGLTRPATDPWAPDLYMTDDQQSIIYPLGGGTNAWFSSPYLQQEYRQWSRGHMLASSYRGCGDKNNPAELNAQTFYAANIAPQKGGAFDKLWQQAEFKVYDHYVCADTLYCISGAYFANDDLKAMDASWYSKNLGKVVNRSGYAKECVVPTHYYKLVLRTKTGKTGRPVQECAADELISVGFWFTHADVDPVSGSTDPTLDKRYLKSVADIEKLTGITFFPDVPEAVKKQCNPSDWGF